MRAFLERQQVWIYLAAIGLGLLVGREAESWAPIFERLLWPALALLLYTAFVQVPLLHLRDAWSDRRFFTAALLGNFVAAPLLVVALVVVVLPPDAVLRLGALLVLLVPCTDWFITFTLLGRGDVARAIALSPLLLALQLVLLPLYLWLLPWAQLPLQWRWADLAPALAVVLLPLLAAALSERRLQRQPQWPRWRERLAAAPVPLLAVVVFLIAAAQVGAVRAALPDLAPLLPLYGLYLLGAAALAWVLARIFRLPALRARTLAFSLGTRNSFVVLPLALTLPAGWELASVAIVLQALVELLGMAGYLWALPRLFRVAERGAQALP